MSFQDRGSLPAGAPAAFAATIERTRSERRQRREDWFRKGYYQNLTLADRFEAASRRSPDTPLVFWSEERPATTTIAGIHAEGMRVAAGLAAMGFRAGDIIVAQVPHWAEGVSFYIGAMHLGVIVAPVIHVYGPAELGFILRTTRARGLVTPAAWRRIDYAARFRAMGDLPDLEHVFVIGDGDFPGPATHWDELTAPRETVERHAAAPDDISTLFFTSGTTSTPKGVLHSHQTLGSKVATMESRWALQGPRSCLVAMPAGHMAGTLSLLRPFFTGDTNVSLDHWNPEAAAELVRRHDLMMTTCAPYHLETLLAATGDAPLPSLKNARTGGAGVPPDLIRRAELTGLKAGRTYGSTEHPAISSGFDGDSFEKRAFTDGGLNPGTGIRLLDHDDRPAPTGEPGEICSMAPELFVGYFDADDETGAFTPEGFFRTGDVGVLDADGYLTIVDRKKDIIIRGGENLSSREIEEVLRQHPDIVEAAVVPCPDPVYGERVGAFIQTSPGATVTSSDVDALFRALGLARQKTPERLFFVESFPKTALGKIQKSELKRIAAQPATDQPEDAETR